MTRDPLGKRALFSGTPTPEAPQPKHGPLDVTVACSSCNASTTLTPPEFVLQQFPVWAWLPWRRDGNLMRCPACKQLAWCAVSRAR